MSAIRIDGKLIAAQIRSEAAEEAAALAAGFRKPCLAVILVGDDPASRVYVNNKKKACESCGVTSLEYALPAGTKQAELLELIRTLNENDGVDGILCQLPLPAGLDATAVIDAISPDKDVDGFSPVNVGKMLTGEACFLPCTPAGIVELLRRSGIGIAGKRCVIVGRSNIVGKPAAALMLRENATVTVCHSFTRDLSSHTREADILIAAVRKPRFITADMVRPGAVVVDVGIHRTEGGALCGDVDADAVGEVAGALTPVPGGVGPMTSAILMKNTVAACAKRRDEKTG